MGRDFRLLRLSLHTRHAPTLASIGALLDLATDARPVALVGDERRLQALDAKTPRRIARLLADQAPHRNEVKKLVAVSLQGRQDLDQLLVGEALRKA